MNRLGLAASIVAALGIACERSSTTTPPAEPSTEAQPQPAPAAEPEAEPEAKPEVEAEPAPAPEVSEVSEVNEPELSKDGFEARGLKCKLNNPTRNGDRYIIAGLVDADGALDACAPKGAAVDVSWSYVSNQAADISVEATTSSIANCVGAAMREVRAGVEANCSAILLIGDPAGAIAAYEAR